MVISVFAKCSINYFIMENENDVEKMDVVDDTSDFENPEVGKESDEIDTGGDLSVKRKVYLPGQALKNDEVLEHDPSAYVMLHEAYAGKCLMFS